MLVVAPYLPWPADFGGALRIYHLVRRLAETCEVTLLAPVRRDEFDSIIRLGDICDVTAVPAEWTPRHPAGRRKRLAQITSLVSPESFIERTTRNEQMQAAIDRLFLTKRINLVQFEFARMALYTLPRPCPTVIDAIDVEHDLLRRVAALSDTTLRRVFNRAEYRKMRYLEIAAWRRATVNIATSERDATIISELSGTQALVVPNGVETTTLSTIPEIKREPNRLVFVGAIRHQPNADGARWFIDEVLPLVRRSFPDVSVAIVGADPPPQVAARASDTVTVTGRVDDVRPYLASASVAIVPLHSGGGTRLKILEAFAAGVPVVSTTIGAEGLEVTNGRDILLADNPEDFAAAIARLLGDHALQQHLTVNAADTARRYDWDTIAPKLVAAHDLAIERFANGRADKAEPASTES